MPKARASRRRRRRAGWVQEEVPLPLPLRAGLGERVVPLLLKFFFNFLNENGVLMHCGTLVFKLMCLQQKASHQTSRHRACRFVVKIRCATRRGEHTPKYATVLGQFCYTVQQHAVYNNQNAECSHFSGPPCAHPFTQQAALAPYQNATPHPRTYCHALRNIHIYAPSKELRTTMRRDITQRNTCCYSLRCGRTTYERLNLTAVEAHAVNVQCYSAFTMALTQRTCTA